MIGMFGAILVFNGLCLKLVRRLSGSQILHVWMFTIAFQNLFDLYVDLKFHGYWYFTKSIDLISAPAICFLIPPINVLYVNYFPFKKKKLTQLAYILIWTGLILVYELFSLLPKPIGYFHYGWWNIGYSALVDPILLFIVQLYFRLILKLEKKNLST